MCLLDFDDTLGLLELEELDYFEDTGCPQESTDEEYNGGKPDYMSNE